MSKSDEKHNDAYDIIKNELKNLNRSKYYLSKESFNEYNKEKINILSKYSNGDWGLGPIPKHSNTIPNPKNLLLLITKYIKYYFTIY